MKLQQQNIERYIPWILFVALLAYYLSGSNASIFMYDEARNAGCAREMFERADMVVPTFNYELRTDKPPLHYWFMMVSFSLFGVNEFSARLFSAILGALTVLMMYCMALRYFGLKAALYAVLVFATSLNLLFEFHLAVPDPYLIFFLTAAHFSFFLFYDTRKTRYLLWLYLATGLAILAKGPVALGFVGLNGMIWLLVKKDFNWKTIAAFKIWLGIAIVAIVVAPWVIQVGIATQWEWPKAFIFEHNISRFSNEMEGHGGLFLLIPAFAMLAFLPFSVFLYQAYRKAFRMARQNDFILWSIIVSLVILIFFSFSATKLPNYPMPAYPFVALILGYYLSDSLMKEMTSMLLVNILIGVAIPVAGYIAISKNPNLVSITPVLYLLTLIPITAVLALLFSMKGFSKWWMLGTLASGWIVAGWLTFSFVMPDISRNEPGVKAAAAMDKTRPVAYYKQLNSSFPFYLQKPIYRLESQDEVVKFFNMYPSGYLITTAGHAKDLDLKPLSKLIGQKELFESPTTKVYYWPLANPEKVE